MYQIKPSSKFQKDVKRVQRRGYNISLLTDILKKLAAGEPLPPKNKDHALVGNYEGCRECHIAPDWLLIYEIVDDTLILYLTRTGSHSDLFQCRVDARNYSNKQQPQRIRVAAVSFFVFFPPLYF